MYVSFPSGRFISSKQTDTFRFNWGTTWLLHWRICSPILLSRTEIRGTHSLWALPALSPPILGKLPGAKEVSNCNHLPEPEMQAPIVPLRLTEASPEHITAVSSNFNNVSNMHIFLEGWSWQAENKRFQEILGWRDHQTLSVWEMHLRKNAWKW